MCVLSTGQTEVTIGEQTSVCLVVNGLEWVVDDTAATFYSQVLILPDADEFSRFSVKGCESGPLSVFSRSWSQMKRFCFMYVAASPGAFEHGAN